MVIFLLINLLVARFANQILFKKIFYDKLNGKGGGLYGTK